MSAGAEKGMRGYTNAAARAARLEHDGYRCRTCWHDGSVWRLEVHHLTYARVGREEIGDLITLCAQCHAAITDLIRRRREVSVPEFAATERPTPVAIPIRVAAQLPRLSATERPTPATVPTRAQPPVADVCAGLLKRGIEK